MPHDGKILKNKMKKKIEKYSEEFFKPLNRGVTAVQSHVNKNARRVIGLQSFGDGVFGQIMIALW